jgi:hypothetical protein
MAAIATGMTGDSQFSFGQVVYPVSGSGRNEPRFAKTSNTLKKRHASNGSGSDGDPADNGDRHRNGSRHGQPYTDWHRAANY